MHLSRPMSEFADLLFSCRKQWKSGWSKEFREMEEEKLLRDSDRVYEKLDDAEAGGGRSGDICRRPLAD